MMTNTAAADLGAVLAQHPMGWWGAGMGAFALMGMVALAGLRALRHASPPLDRLLPGLEARGLMLAAIVAYILSLDEEIVPGEPGIEQPVPAMPAE